MGKEQDLLEASRSGQYNIIEKILNARVKKSGPLNLTSLRRIPGPNTTDPRNGFTCLHYASLNGHKNIVRILLEHGANPNVVDHNGSSPLHLASWTGDYEIVDMLISNNNDLKAQIDLKNNENESPLHLACRYGHTPVVSLLLTQGADPFIQNIRQETPLDLAAQYGRLETVELLLRLRFDLLNEYLPTNHKNDKNNNDTTNEDQETRMNHRLAEHSPLHLASRNGHKSIVKLLLDLGFDVDYLTKNGTALFESVICGKNEIVRLLLEAGTNVELRNEKGQKVEQLLDGLNTAVAKQTKKLIREHISVTNTDLGYDGSTDRTLDSDEQAMLMRMISSPVTISESISTTIAASNSFCDQEDLTIVDSMLNEDIPIMYDHHRHHNLNDDDLMDDHCISPPPGYTDNNNQNDNHQDGHPMLDGDCVSPSSSLFSTSIFSELASIFEEHLQRNPMDRSNNNINNNNFNDQGFHQLQDNSSGQIKSSNSFTLIGTDHNSLNEIQNYHQSHEIPSFHSPNRRMTTPNLIPNNHLHRESHPKMMSTSLNSNNSSSDGGELRKYFVNSTDNQKRDNDRDSMMVSSNYSISSNASSSNAQLNSNDETTTAKISSIKQPRPPKPPRKSIDKLYKAKSMECGTVIMAKAIENIDMDKCMNIGKAISSNLMMSKATTESNGSSDVADSSDHSASQNVDSVISNGPKTKYSIQKTKKKEISPIKYEMNLKSNGQSENQLPSMSSGHSIDDFYMLYDQAAREEYENDKQDVRNCLFNQSSKHSNSMDLLKKKEEEEVELVSANNTIKTIVEPNLMVQDPPSPNSAETEIIHKIEPLKQQFYDQKPAITKRHKRKKTLEASVMVSEEDKRFTDTKNTKTSCHNDHSIIKCDNWTLTDDDILILNNSDAKEQKEKQEIQPKKESIGINVQIGDDYRNVKGAKLITECGREGQELSSSNHHHRHRNKKQSQALKHGQRRNDHQKMVMGKENIVSNNNHTSTKNNDYFSAYCETLKFDRKGEKENPFAGLCRGGLTPAKSNPNHHRKEQQQQPNGTMEKKKKTVELSEARKSLRKQRSILSGRAESLSKLNKLSVYNGGSQDFSDNNNNADGNGLETSIFKSIDQKSNNSNNGNSAMITQPNNIYATLRKKKKSKSLNGDHHLTVMIVNDTNNNKNNIDNNIGHEDDHEVHRNGSTKKTEATSNAISSIMDQSQQILLWLDEIGMKHYRDLLIQNGYDDLDFMDNNVMDDNDLIEIGIIQASHRESILNAAKQLPYKTPKLTRDQILTFSVAQWLQQLHLKQYVNIFHSNGLIELKKIRHLWEIELDIMLDIDKIGHRRRILFSLSDLKSRDSLIVSDNSDVLSPWLTDNASTCTNLDREREREQLEWKGWKHARHELVNGSCQYLVSYLGSTLVRELRGIDSTRASIGKLKASGEQQQHMKILLSISCQGVQFKDPKSNKLICEHEIRNIHCICQDSEDLNYFAYITKDFESNNHYCHVFMSKQTDLVTEIILTLGQAFEIAYQIVLEQYNIHVKQQQQQQNSSSDNNLTNNSNFNEMQSSNSNYTTYTKGNNQNSDFKKQTPFKKDDQQHLSSMSSNNNNNSNDDNDKKDQTETLLSPIFSKPENVLQNTVKEKIPIDYKTVAQKENIPEQETRNESKKNVPATIEPVNVDGREEEQLYAVVDKSRKTKKQLPQQSQSLSSTNIQDENFENRPIPPIRSSSTASSNSSTGPRPEQPQNKPKPPIRVASMQNQQKPEVSPKPKNLINKSNTVQLASSNLNNKPVLARFCAYLQPDQQSQQPQKPNHFNGNNNVTSLSSNSSSSTINNLHPQTKQFHQKF